MTFAKIFETKNGQVVVMRDTNGGGEPVVKFYAQPEGVGVCCNTLSFSDKSGGEVTRDIVFNVFNDANLELVERVTKALISF